MHGLIPNCLRRALAWPAREAPALRRCGCCIAQLKQIRPRPEEIYSYAIVHIDDALLNHAAPLGWEHISLTGDYLWGDMKLPKDGFRPLRTQNRQSEA
jgi:hypothetical protein